jgi:hypothetical protein
MNAIDGVFPGVGPQDCYIGVVNAANQKNMFIAASSKKGEKEISVLHSQNAFGTLAREVEHLLPHHRCSPCLKFLKLISCSFRVRLHILRSTYPCEIGSFILPIRSRFTFRISVQPLHLCHNCPVRPSSNSVPFLPMALRSYHPKKTPL